MSTFDDPDLAGQAGQADDSAAEDASGEDAERGNLDGSTAHAKPRQDALDAAQTQAEGQTDELRESGQDNGLSD